jgi:hypothetical protein
MLITGCTAAVVTWSNQAVSFIQQKLYAKHRLGYNSCDFVSNMFRILKRANHRI